MTPEHWARLKEICGTALEIPEGKRDPWLDSICGDDEALRAEVEQLLAQDQETLKSPLSALPAGATPGLTAGDMLSHYRVIAKAGEGGMGAVYRAYDTQLRRPVALKVLPPGHLADPERAHRLLREARAASALNHPNIVGIYEVGCDQGVNFIAMEFVEGNSLKQLIPHKGLPLDQALNYAAQLADGLARAHAAGLVHRDLKPANIIVTPDGLVKILDFGLARRTRLPQEETTLTIAAQIAGTPAYMSPEQARGEELDARSDLFSLGTVLYEMVTGALPFQGATPAVIFEAILNRAPIAAARLRPELPAEWERILAKALEKDRESRYQEAKDLSVDLRRLRRDTQPGLRAGGRPSGRHRIRLRTLLTGVAVLTAIALVGLVIQHRRFGGLIPAVAPGRASLAVLPFLNLSADPENQYFSDGMTEEIINKLSRIQGLAVASRTAVARFRGSREDTRQIGQELRVRYLLEGSVRRQGSRVRTTTQLIDASTGFHLWGEDFDGDLKDVFAVQEATALKIAEALDLRLSPQERQAIQRRYTDNVQAYDAYLRGNALIEFLGNPEKLEAGRRYFEQALESDPSYPLALAGLAWVEAIYYRNIDAAPAHLARAEELARRALALDAGLPQVHAALGAVHACRYEYSRAAAEFREAVRLAPENADNWDNLAWALAYEQPPQGQAAESAARESIRLQPTLARTHYHLGRSLCVQRRYQEAIAAFNHGLELDPTFVFARGGLGEVYLAQGDFRRALAELRGVPRNPLWDFRISEALAAQGEKEEAIAALEQAMVSGYRDFAAIDASRPLASLRSDARFPQLMRKYKK